MRRYLVFGGYNYYPCGGFEDFRGSLEDREAAISLAKELRREILTWSHVVDGQTGEVIDSGVHRSRP